MRVQWDQQRGSIMSRMAYVLRLMSGLMMAVAVVLAVVSLSDVADNLGRPAGDHVLGGLMLAAFACFLAVFVGGGILWVLTDISDQLAPAPKPHPETERGDEASEGWADAPAKP
jgi:hypothetical protein